MSDEDLAEVNSCLESFDVTMYRGDDGRCRLWGDINRIQDVVDGGCADLFPPGAREDLDWFFAHEVDAHVVRCLGRLGVRAVYDPDVEIGIGLSGSGPSDVQMTAAFRETYDWYRVPPHQRTTEP